MEVQELRAELHELIKHADERFLKMVYAMSKEYLNTEIIGYDTDGSPITQQGLKDRVKAASRRVKSGDFLTKDEIEKEIENW